jgi:hypothetical protein
MTYFRNHVDSVEEKLCFSHRERRKGSYVYKVENGRADKKHQRFFCHECINKYDLSAFVIPVTRRPRAALSGTRQECTET